MNFEELVGAVAGLVAEGAPAKFWAQLRPWLRDFGESVVVKWGPHMSSLTRCQHRYVNHRQCDSPSVASCEACGAPACANHCRFGRHADVICESCVEEHMKKKIAEAAATGFGDSWRRRTTAGREAPPAPAGDTRAAHLKVLGLSGKPTWDQIHTRFRELAIEKHPDRASPGKRAEVEREFARITAAYEALKRSHHGRAA